MTPHAHREGHLIFYISEATARMMVADNLFLLDENTSSAVNPWEAHTFQINGASCSAACICLVLYIKPVWFLPNAQSGVHRLAFGRPGIRITTDLSRLAVSLAAALLDGIDDRDIEPLCREVTRLAHMLSWEDRKSPLARGTHTATLCDFRVRRSLRLLDAFVGDDIEIESVAREVGPLPPALLQAPSNSRSECRRPCISTRLRSERAIESLILTDRSLANIGPKSFGFSSQASFSRSSR